MVCFGAIPRKSDFLTFELWRIAAMRFLIAIFCLIAPVVSQQPTVATKNDSITAENTRCDDLLTMLQRATECRSPTEASHMDFNNSCSKTEKLERSAQCVNNTVAECSLPVQNFIKNYINVHGHYRATVHACKNNDAFSNVRSCLAMHKRYVGFCEREQNYVLHEFREMQKGRPIDNLTEFTNQLVTVQCRALKKFVECLNREFTYLCHDLTTQMLVKYNLIYLPNVCYDDWVRQMDRLADEMISRKANTAEVASLRITTKKGTVRRVSAGYQSQQTRTNARYYSNQCGSANQHCSISFFICVFICFVFLQFSV